ncbi:GNAT family N-acetyltransferase [bacterium]|nr:GNAT family N-acetyltransferase [bacterium]
MGIHLSLESILAGATEAKMFVDSEKLRAALTWKGHRLYLAGEICGDLAGAITDFVTTRKLFVAYPSPETLDSAEKLLTVYGVKRKKRYYYEGDPTAREWIINSLGGYTFERITDVLLGRNLMHSDWVREELCSERASVEEFLAKSFGFAAIHSGEFACWCTSEYNLGDRCEVGIETAPEYRRRGLATLVASMMFGHASDVGIRRVGWHCWADNVASIATAEKLGLRLVAEYTVLVSS